MCNALTLKHFNYFLSQNLLDDEDNFLKAMANMGVDGHGPDFNAGVFPMMQGMMMNLLSKDVLYPALNELKTKVYDSKLCFQKFATLCAMKIENS